MATTTATTTTTNIINRPPLPPIPKTPPRRARRRPGNSLSTPNLNQAYSSHSRRPLPSTPGRVASRKASLAALTQKSLANVPDVDENYVFDQVLSDSYSRNMAPLTPRGYTLGDDLAVGDVVDVPGGMHGYVRFVGNVNGKKGTFAGVELHQDFAVRGKNSGDVDGISYFMTTIPGAGIFVPLTKAMRRDEPSRPSSRAFPRTPTASGLKAGNQNSTNFTPPTPSLPKFSASVGPGARAPSPGGKRPRTSLPRPDSPQRRMQMTPGPRPSFGAPAKTPNIYGSPTNRFAQSVRGTAGDPSKGFGNKPSLGPRSVSALGFDDDDPVPIPVGLPRNKTTSSSIGSASSFAKPTRPASRANGAHDGELDRLRAKLDDRNRQLTEQSATLIEMESSLTELQTLMENSELPKPRSNSLDDQDSGQLRALLREKNQKIAMLTAEFDAHRADFRSTIDTLEMASTETERVYEKRMEELMADIRELESRNLDVDSVASQLKQLEELVQELEEGLEDARRGEAEARGEVEFLRGEVERTRAELRREREKAATMGSLTGDRGSSKELEQKEDEIRGLKAIIHSLSRDAEDRPGHRPGSMQRRTSIQQKRGSLIAGDVIEHKIARDNLERQVAELQGIMNHKDTRMEEMEQELEKLRVTNVTNANRGSFSARRSSLRDSRDTVVLASGESSQSPEAKRSSKLETMAESDVYSNATGDSTLWCEICETGGHDILSCTNMFGSEAAAKTNGDKKRDSSDETLKSKDRDSAHPAPLSPAKSKPATTPPGPRVMPNPMDFGPIAGKESGVMDPEKWCAVCERDGHDSVDCPFEDAF